MLVAIWGPSRRYKELTHFCIPEFETLVHRFGHREFRFETRTLHASNTYRIEDISNLNADRNDILVAAEACVLVHVVAEFSAWELGFQEAVDFFRAQFTESDDICDVKFVSMRGTGSVQANSKLKAKCMTAIQRLGAAVPHRHGGCQSTLSRTHQIIWIEVEGKHCIGRVLATGTRARDHDGKVIAAPTAMDPLLVRLSLNFSGACKGSVLLDTCCGSGSIPLVAAEEWRCHVLLGDADSKWVERAMASEMGNQQDRGLLLDAYVGDFASAILRPNSIDCIVTDPPYGYREKLKGKNVMATRVKGDMMGAEGLSQLNHFFHKASGALVPGGMLVYWTMYSNEETFSPGEIRAELELLYLLPETRKSGLPRCLLVWRKKGKYTWPGCCGDSRRLAPKRGPTEKFGQRVEQMEFDSLGRFLPHHAVMRRKSMIDVWRCAWLGDVRSLRRYIDAGGDPNAHDSQNRSPIIFASGYGRVEATRMLLLAGADPEIADSKRGMNALHRAASRNHTEVISLLLHHTSNISKKTKTGETAMHLAAQFGWVDSVSLLIEHMQRSGADVLEALGMNDNDGLTALHAACKWGKHHVARIFLEAGMNPDTRSSCQLGLTAAHLAARWGHHECLQVLHQFGANFKLESQKGKTPLSEAVEWSRHSVIALLSELEHV